MKSSALEITLKEFMAIAEIPRPSHHEEKIGAYLVKWAQKRGLTVEQDAIGDVNNVILHGGTNYENQEYHSSYWPGHHS